MSRYFVPITLQALEEKIVEALKQHPEAVEDGITAITDEPRCLATLTPAVEKDLAKVRFDTENLLVKPFNQNTADCLGLRQLSNGLSMLGCLAGGDWETPVYFIIYWDGRQLRGYIPSDGNTWNRTTHTAYGNDDAADLPDLKKQGLLPDSAEDPRPFNGVFDCPKMMADIAARIQPRQ